MIPHKKRNLVDGILRACELLHSFRTDTETLRLTELVRRTGLKKTTVFRATQSLVEGGMLERSADGQFRCLLRPSPRRRYRLGYATQASDSGFAHDVTEGLRRAAEEASVELVEVGNNYSPKIALRSAETLIRARVSLAVEFQTFESVAPIISAKLAEACIPLIAIDIPHPGATYYGADNYNAGRIGGRAAARWVQKYWRGRADEVVLLTVTAAGTLPNSRLGGFCEGLQEAGVYPSDQQFVCLDSNGAFGATLDVVRKHLRSSRSERILVAGFNDPCSLAALHAFEETGRLDHCAVMSQGASTLGRVELRRPDTRLIGSVAFFPEKYGDGIIRLALDILAKRPRPSAVFVKHILITAANVDHYYPNDSIISAGDSEAMLIRYGH
ncbi:MAG: helix-turn-helix domain-containing protein [Acidobacteriales bacterium]|nr:helix-turn-helix domain-containing protein [Terriglobales bacterium]